MSMPPHVPCALDCGVEECVLDFGGNAGKLRIKRCNFLRHANPFGGFGGMGCGCMNKNCTQAFERNARKCGGCKTNIGFEQTATFADKAWSPFFDKVNDRIATLPFRASARRIGSQVRGHPIIQISDVSTHALFGIIANTVLSRRI